MSNDKNKMGDSEFFDDSEGVCSYIIVENTGLFYNDFYEQVFTNSKWPMNIKKQKILCMPIDLLGILKRWITNIKNL